VSLLNRIRQAFSRTPAELPPNRAMTQYEHEQYQRLVTATTEVVEVAAAFVAATSGCIEQLKYTENARLEAKEMNKRIRNQFAYTKGLLRGKYTT